MPENLQRLNILFDFYGDLLTEKQRAYFMMHYMEDLSLAEMGQTLGVTPQAAADLLKRTCALLCGYEEKLRLAEKHTQQLDLVQKIYQALDEIACSEYTGKIALIRQWADEMLL